jgi:hypothetical protein
MRVLAFARHFPGSVVGPGSATSQVRESDLRPSDEDLSPGTLDLGNPALRRSVRFLSNRESRKRLQLALYSPPIATGSGAPFGEDRYPVTVFLALTLFTTISNNMGSLPL